MSRRSAYYACLDRSGEHLGYVYAETQQKAGVLGLEKRPETYGSCFRFEGTF